MRLLVNEKPMKIGICGDSSKVSDCHMTGSDCRVTDKDGDESRCHVTEEEGGKCHQELFLCGLDALTKKASNLTNGFSTLTELCKAATA